MPIFLVMLMGLIDFSRLFWHQTAVTQAAGEGTRLAMLHEPADAEIETAVKQWLVREGLDTTATVTISERVSSEPVSVPVSIPFDFYTLNDLLKDFTGVQSITATSAMIHER